MFIYVCRTTAYTGIIRVVVISCNPHEASRLPQDFRVPLAMSAPPLRLLRLSRLWMLSKTLRETLTRSRWQHVSTYN